MEFVKAKNYDAMSDMASDLMMRKVQEKPHALFCLATGSSPTASYHLFVEKVKKEKLDVSKLKIVKLDEWFGLPESSPATCEYYLQENLLKPLHISKDRYIAFHPMEENTQFECSRIERLIQEAGGIDLCILGLGRNGHLGFNEPAEKSYPFTHKALLETKTKSHPMLVGNQEEAQYGYTLGIGNLLRARAIAFLITGQGKKEAYEAFQKAFLSAWHPANYLWLHKDVTCFVDEESV